MYTPSTNQNISCRGRTRNVVLLLAVLLVLQAGGPIAGVQKMGAGEVQAQNVPSWAEPQSRESRDRSHRTEGPARWSHRSSGDRGNRSSDPVPSHSHTSDDLGTRSGFGGATTYGRGQSCRTDRDCPSGKYCATIGGSGKKACFDNGSGPGKGPSGGGGQSPADAPIGGGGWALLCGIGYAVWKLRGPSGAPSGVL